MNDERGTMNEKLCSLSVVSCSIKVQAISFLNTNN